MGALVATAAIGGDFANPMLATASETAVRPDDASLRLVAGHAIDVRPQTVDAALRAIYESAWRSALGPEMRPRMVGVASSRHRAFGRAASSIAPVATGAVATSAANGSTAAATAKHEGTTAKHEEKRPAATADDDRAAEGQPGATQRFDIKSAPIKDVLIAFEAATGIAISAPLETIHNITSPGVTGSFTPQQALRELLAGTGLTARFTAPKAANVEVRLEGEAVEVLGRVNTVQSPKYREPLRDTPQTVVVIPQAVMQQQAATSLRDVLRNTPGITFQAGEGGSAAGDNLFIRGFSARNDVLIDGMRDPGVLSRDSFNLEAVEVAKGPASAIAGRGSTGGAVNLVTKAANATNFAEVRLMAGNADNKRTTLDANRKVSESVAVRFNAMWQDSGVPGRDIVENKGVAFAPSVVMGLNKPTQVTANYQMVRQDNLPGMGLPGTLPALAVTNNLTVDDLDWSNFYGLTARDHEKIDSDIASVIVDHRFSGNLSLRNLTRGGRNVRDAVYTPPRAASATQATNPNYNANIAQMSRNDFKSQDRNDQTYGNQTNLTVRARTGAIQHEIATGVEFSLERQNSYNRVFIADPAAGIPVTDLFNPNPDDNLGNFQVARDGAVTHADAVGIGAYAFDTVKLDEHWSVDVGARWDRVDADYDTTSAAGVVANFDRVDSSPSWRTGVIYKPVERGSIYGAYSTSFNPSVDTAWGLTLTTATEALPPEKSRNIEVGTKWDLVQGRLFGTLALFHMEKTNARTTDVAGNTVLAGNQRVRGVEFGLSGNVTAAWTVFTGLALMNTEIVDSGVAAEVDKQLPYAPNQSFNLWSTYRLPIGVTVGGGAQFTGGYFFNATNALTTANQTAINDATRYWLFSAMAAYDVNRHLSLQVNAQNLANERYVERANGGHFLPGPGRAIIISPVFKF